MAFRFAARTGLVALSCGGLLLSAACGGGDGTPNEPLPAPVTTGSVLVAISGLPAGLTPTFTLQSSDGQTRAVTVGDTVRNIPAGTTVLRATSASAPDIGRWVPFRERYEFPVLAGAVANQTVQFAAAGIVFTPAASGLPASVTAPLRFTSPQGQPFSVSAGTPFVTSTVGRWILQGQQVSAENYLWVPTDAPVERNVLPGDTIAITFAFAVGSGAIEIAATGLAEATQPEFTVTQGTTTFSRTGPGIIPNLAPGDWEVSSGTLSADGFRFAPTSPSQSVAVELGATTTASTSYTATPILANAMIEGAYLTQAIQTFDGTTPLVAGREALLRVFLRANEPNDWQPRIRVSLFQGTSLLDTLSLTSAALSIDTLLNEGNLERSWNARLPGALLVPGLRILVEADPDGLLVGDSDPADNIWPRDGQPALITVEEVPTWKAVLVPVSALPTNVAGNVSEQNKDSYLSLVRRLMPINDVSVRVRDAYSANVASLQQGDANGAWVDLLEEINALRAAEGEPGEYWYGVVNVDYASGIAGYGFVPGRAAVGWDRLPSGDGIAAHEWGHNFGRRHAPCGNVGGADGAFPDAGGRIGAYGWNSTTNRVIFPSASDVMGYCNNQWVSPYTWRNALQYRVNAPNAFAQPTAQALAAVNHVGRLLVWGSLRNGRVTVEPAFFLEGRGVSDRPDPLPGDARPVAVEALDAAGRVVVSSVVDAPSIDHATGDVRAFATTLALSAAEREAIVSLRVRDLRTPLSVGRQQRTARAIAAAAAASTGTPPPSTLEANRVANRLQLHWDATQFPRALVRDAATGRILGFARRSGDGITLPSGAVDVILSDGVRSRTERITP